MPSRQRLAATLAIAGGSIGLTWLFTQTPSPDVHSLSAVEPVVSLRLDGAPSYTFLPDGSLLNLQASAQYRVMDNVGIGVAYRYVDYDLDVEKDTYTASYDYNFWGPSFFIEIGF